MDVAVVSEPAKLQEINVSQREVCKGDLKDCYRDMVISSSAW